MSLQDTLLSMKRGDTPLFQLTVKNSDGTPFDITGSKIWMTAKRSQDDADPGVFQISTTSGDITLSDPANGIALITVPATATSGLTVDERLFYDVQVKTSTSKIHTVVAGILSITRDITRAIA